MHFFKNKIKLVQTAIFVFILGVVSNPSALAFFQDHEVEKNSFSRYLAFEGGAAGEQRGTEVEVGDINNDGYKDIALSSTFFSSEGESWRGKVTILWGPQFFESRATTIIGEDRDDQLGTALAIGDINGDGIEDLAIGAYQADVGEIELAGKVYIFNGGSGFHNDKTVGASSADIIFNGDKDSDRLGLSLAVGDVNGDEIDDLLMSAPGGEGEQSMVYGLLGGDYFPPNHRFDVVQDALIIVLGTKDEIFGSDLAIGDFDGDGIGDMAIGAYTGASDSKEQNGKVYVIKGRELKATRDTNNKYEYDLLRFPSIAKILTGKQSKEWFGFSTAARNVNDDKFDDLLVGSFMYLYKDKTGKVSLYHGNRDFFDENLKPDFQVIGDETQNLLGASYDFGDLDGDGNLDMAMGAPGVTAVESVDPGALYVLPEFNNSEGGTFALPREIAHAVVRGEEADDWFGAAVKIEDLNNDGFDDVLVGAPYSDNESGHDTGTLHIYFGGDDLDLMPPNVVSADLIGRGEAIAAIVDGLELETREEKYLEKCREEVEFCLFNFATQSQYENISFTDLELYPDVPSNHEYYSQIVTATLLDLVHGYFDQESSPFRPDNTLKRAHAVKIMIGAMEELEWKYKYELKQMYDGEVSQSPSYFEDVSSEKEHMWWYVRYLNHAADIGLVEKGGLFRPDEDITKDEFMDLIERAKEITNS